MGGSAADTPATPDFLRASDADRDHAVDKLRQEFVEDLRIENMSVSRLHAQLNRAGDGWLLNDLGSHNGTRVNGWLVREPVPVRAGDLVQFGSATFIIQTPSQDQPGEPVSPGDRGQGGPEGQSTPPDPGPEVQGPGSPPLWGAQGVRGAGSPSWRGVRGVSPPVESAQPPAAGGPGGVPPVESTE